MLAIKLRSNLQQFSRSLSEAQRRQVPFAAATAINAIGTGVQADIVASMQTTFDRPTPWTLRATYLKKARKSDLRAFVGIREFAGKGTPAWKYLGPQASGGARGQKRFERRLQATNNAAAFAVPGRGARLDAYGNMSRGQIGQILAALGAFPETGQNTTAASASRRKRKGMLVHGASRGAASDYFVAKSKRSGKPLGVYQLVGRGKVEPVLLFTDNAPQYQARWPIADIVLKSIETHRQGAFERAWAMALATAR